MHLCAELIAASIMLEPLGEVGAYFSLQLSSRTQFTKINNKKVIAENQSEKHKKSSLDILFYQMHRNVMHIKRVEVGVYTLISPLSIGDRILTRMDIFFQFLNSILQLV